MIVGRPGAVSAGVATLLRTITGAARISRFGGADRYATSVAVAKTLFLWTEGYEPGRVFIAAGWLVLVRDEDTSTGYDLAIFTTDTTAAPGQVVARYAER